MHLAQKSGGDPVGEFFAFQRPIFVFPAVLFRLAAIDRKSGLLRAPETRCVALETRFRSCEVKIVANCIHEGLVARNRAVLPEQTEVQGPDMGNKVQSVKRSV